MQLILAEFCGRWGCTWQEGIINVILASLDGKSALILLCILLLPIFLGVLMLLAGLVTVYEFISGWSRALLGIPNLNKSQQQDIPEPAETVVNTLSNEAVNNSVDYQPQRKRNLAAAKLLGRTLRTIAKN